ncbi:MAG: class B sortase [Bacilli bacterium]|nr:class B sortase [Bacilli bacterium]
MKIKWKNLFILMMMFIFIIIFIISLINIIKWKIDSNIIVKQINDLKNTEIKETLDDDNTELINPDENKENPYWDYIKMNLMSVNFADLKTINSDVVGWIKVNGTNINYPFVQTNNNDYYLTRDFNKNYNDAGWVFMDYRNNINDFDKNTILYAHGRLDTTMFGSLKNIIKSNWYNNKNNHVIKLSTEKENTLWQVFSVYHIKRTSDYIETNFYDDEVYQEFLNMLKNRSTYNFNLNLNTQDKIITLSTCYSKEEKVVMHAKLIKKAVR